MLSTSTHFVVLLAHNAKLLKASPNKSTEHKNIFFFARYSIEDREKGADSEELSCNFMYLVCKNALKTVYSE